MAFDLRNDDDLEDIVLADLYDDLDADLMQHHARSIKPENSIKPFHQGQLDQLCGIYAVLNAINFASSKPIIDHG